MPTASLRIMGGRCGAHSRPRVSSPPPPHRCPCPAPPQRIRCRPPRRAGRCRLCRQSDVVAPQAMDDVMPCRAHQDIGSGRAHQRGPAPPAEHHRQDLLRPNVTGAFLGPQDPALVVPQRPPLGGGQCAGPALMAGLPGTRAWVRVGPPLLASVGSRMALSDSTAGTTSVAPGLKPTTPASPSTPKRLWLFATSVPRVGNLPPS